MNSLHIAINMLKRTLGQRRGVLLFLIVPALVVSAIIGILGREPSKVVEVAYFNADQGNLSKYVLSELSSFPDYRMKEVSSEEELKDLVISQKAGVGLRIPASFSQTFYNSDKPQVDMYQLNTNEATFTFKLNVDSIINRLSQTIEQVRASGADRAGLQSIVDKAIAQIQKHQVKASVTDYNLYLNHAMNAVIGFMLMFMMGLISNTVMIIMEDRRQRTMARIFTAPIRSIEIALGNFLGSFLVGTLQVLFILIVTRFVLQYNYHLPFLNHFIIMEFFLLACIGIASAIAGLMKNSNNISGINAMVITPTCMLGGCFWPISIMPDWMQKLANFVPQKWVIDGIERMASGQSLSEVALNLGVLALFAFILLGIGSVILQPGEAEVG
jgi:ABC-2 type transport system permease protein